MEGSTNMKNLIQYELDLSVPLEEGSVQLAVTVKEKTELKPEINSKSNAYFPVTYGDHLSLFQLTEVIKLQHEFAHVFFPLPAIMDRHIELYPGVVIHCQPYRLPEHYKKVVVCGIKGYT